MSTQFDEVFDGLSSNSLTLEDACRVLFSELQGSPDSMRVCCERIESELSQGRISSDAAQLLLDALGEHDARVSEEVWVEVPLEPVTWPAARPVAVGRPVTDGTSEADLTVDDLLAALDQRSPTTAKPVPAVDFDVGEAQAVPVEWVEFEPEAQAALRESEALEAAAIRASSAIAPEADDIIATRAVAPEPAIDAAKLPTHVDTLVPAPEAAAEAMPGEPAQPPQTDPSADAPEPVQPATLAAPEVSQRHAEPQQRLEPRHAPVAEAAPGKAVVDAKPALSEAATMQPPASSRPVAASGAALVELAQHASDALWTPRFEHVLRESSPTQLGALVNGRYQVVGMLEPGGFGPLLDAIDKQTEGEPRVTLKMIEVDWQEEPRAFDTLRAIVRHVRRLRHPNILSILDIDRDDGHAIIVMEPLRGRWLSALIREVRSRGIGFAVAWNIISGIANGLAYAHQHGAVHAELNPHMVFLTEEGAVKITGFGLAQAVPMSTEVLAALDGMTLREYADAYCVTNWVHGSTPQEVDDLYPLGVIAYELLTGAHPFDRFSPAQAAARQMQPSQIPGLDRRIRRVIERCLSFDRQSRPVNGAEFLAHIEPAEQLLEAVRERFKRSGPNHSA